MSALWGRLRLFWHGLLGAPFAGAFAILAMVSGARGFLDSDALPVHAVMHGLDYVWAGIFFSGGLLLALGLGFARAKVEAVGLLLFAGGAVIEAIAFLGFLGFTRTSSWVSVFTLMVFAFFALVRVRRLFKGERLVWIQVELEGDTK